MVRGWITVTLVVAILAAAQTNTWAQAGKAFKPSHTPTLASRLGQFKDALVGRQLSLMTIRPTVPMFIRLLATVPLRTNPTGVIAAKPIRGIRARRKSCPETYYLRAFSSTVFPILNRRRQMTLNLVMRSLIRQPRRGSIPSSATTIRTPRKSPSTTRENEFQDALDALLAVEQEQLGDTGNEP